MHYVLILAGRTLQKICVNAENTYLYFQCWKNPVIVKCYPHMHITGNLNWPSSSSGNVTLIYLNIILFRTFVVLQKKIIFVSFALSFCL